MNPEQALKIISSACGEYHGNLKEHQNIQAALNVVYKAVLPEPRKKPDTKTNRPALANKGQPPENKMMIAPENKGNA